MDRYMPSELRVAAFRRCRETLWALDAAWARKPEMAAVINFVRFFGGPIHMMMRRYRFVEEGLTIGTPETEKVIRQTRKNVKLWKRVDASRHEVSDAQDEERYRDLMARSHELMFPGLREYLEDDGDGSGSPPCRQCSFRESYGAAQSHDFGGVVLCESCREAWRRYSDGFATRAIVAFPELTEFFVASTT